MLKFSANISLMFADRPFLERFGAASAAGFSAVEFLLPLDWPLEELAERLEHYNQRVTLMNIMPGDWSAGEALLGSRVYDAADGPTEAMCIVTDQGYGTVSSSLIALPAPEHAEKGHVWRFAPGRPGQAVYAPVSV